MQKTHAIELLGGTVGSAASAMGISHSAVSQWPDVLTPKLIDRVIAGCLRTGVDVPEWVLKHTAQAA